MTAVIHNQPFFVYKDVVRDSVVSQLEDVVYSVELLFGQQIILNHGTKGRYAVPDGD